MRKLLTTLAAVVVFLPRSGAAVESAAWASCSLTEGKGDKCGPSEPPRPFHEFLSPGEWSNTLSGWFTGDFRWNLQQHGDFRSTWREIGRWGNHRIRIVRYAAGDSSFASVVLVENSRNIFAPLLLWSGQMPQAAFHEIDGIQVLVLQKDFGGNIPMVSTWAWIWSGNGPIRLDVDGAIAEAIEKVAPGHVGYSSGLEWPRLHCDTGVWKGPYPGKIGVDRGVEAWFELGPEGLLVRRARFREFYGDSPRTIWWPRTSPGGDAKAKPLRSEIAIELKDARGVALPGLEVRLQGGPAARTDSRGTAVVSLAAPQQEGTPALLEISDASQAAVILSPCRGVLPVAQGNQTVLVARRGDANMLRTAAALAALTDCIVRTAPSQDKYEWAPYQRYRRQALDTVARSAGLDPDALDLSIRAWGRNSRDALTRGLVALYRQRPAEAIRSLREIHNSRNSAQSDFYLGRAFYAQRQLAQSIAAYQRSGAIWPEEPALLASWAWALYELDDFRGAESLLRRALSNEERLFGNNAEGVRQLVNWLAGVLFSTAEYAEIEELHRRARSIAEQREGANSASVAEALHNQGLLAAVRLDAANAKPLLERALSIRQRTLGPDDPETAETMYELALLHYHERNLCTDALVWFSKALAIREKSFGHVHPSTAASVNSMGLCREAAGDWKQAEEHYRDAMSITEATVGEHGPAMADYISNVASLLTNRGQAREAEPMYRRALAIKEAIHGPDHPWLILTIYKLGYAVSQTGRLADAAELLQRAARLREKVSGPDHPDLAYILSNLAVVLLNLGKDNEAEPLLRRALAIQERVLGSESQRHRQDTE
ncbi:MAG: tetratricopeptide repeat protein [Bryobacterales bacterium]|nr:tetratricopeptide repeat protein [Bryobacterales bacterium]